MQATLENLDGYFDDLFLNYPDFEDFNREFLVEEMNALQQLYFEKLMPQKSELSVLCPSEKIIDLKTVTPPVGCEVSERDVIAVHAGTTEIPLLDYVDFERRTGPCCALLSEKLYLRLPESSKNGTVRLLVRCRPKKIYISDGICVGEIYIPEKHLPMLTCKMKECMSRSVGENEDADAWAKAYNEWVAVLENNSHAGRTYGRASL